MAGRPEFQWETPRYRARRLAAVPVAGWHDDPRAEAFELVGADGRVEATCVLGIHEQRMPSALTLDESLILAVRAWLVARGQRAINVRDERGHVRADGSFSLTQLGIGRLEHEPRRLCTLSPSNAELVDALGCFDRVVASEDSSDFPPKVDATERLGPDLDPDLDRVAAIGPDLVVSSLTVPGMERIVTGLATRGLPQIVLAPRCLDDVVEDARRLASHLGVADAAESFAGQFESERQRLAQAAKAGPRARVYLEWWPRPMFTPGRDCYSNELIALAGGLNVFGDRAGSSLQIEPAELVAARPDLCFVSWCGVAAAKLDPRRLWAREGLEELAAAKRRRVYALDEAFAGRPGPRCLEAARIMTTAISDWRAAAS